ncbi:hypothetical protein PLICRDRAFT_88274 [Plicaturopsis crispa FD-325 SS-3]|nr:hypothetical protein PLICRDRAFT_88274 [Plicaturopsis crispa FD-325 SS-3]
MHSLPRRSRRTGTHQGVWNKERFVNAQYRFVMNPTGDYTVHFADPDIFFQWHDILQVIMPRSSALASAAAGHEHTGKDEGHITCPICLSPPTAPRMTKCGHIFCFPCILHYLSTSDNLKWIRCPICFDSVNERQLKSVKWFDGPTVTDDDMDNPQGEGSSASSFTSSAFEALPTEGAPMRMRLMQRPQITTLALPRSATWPSDLVPPHQAPFHFLPDVYNYARFMLATPTYLIADLTRDMDELATERRILSGMDDLLGISFVDAAEQKLRDQIAKAAALETPQLREAVDKALRDQHEIEARATKRRRAEEAASQAPLQGAPDAYLATKTAPATPSSPATNRNPRQRRNLNPPPPSTSTYYYYQAASGLPIFLHPLDIKILLSHFSGYASFPDSITVRVDSVTEGTVNDDLRKRCKYLGHMPEGADVVFVEADLEGVVGADGLKSFEGALGTRRAKRKEKGRKDDRARARAEERERVKEHVYVPSAEWGAVRHVVSPEYERPDTPVEDVVVAEGPQPQPSGAWGARSFASALHSNSPAQGRNGRTSRPTGLRDEADEWDMDIAWHELEQRGSGGGGGGGKKKKAKGLVVLGGGGGRRR